MLIYLQPWRRSVRLANYSFARELHEVDIGVPFQSGFDCVPFHCRSSADTVCRHARAVNKSNHLKYLIWFDLKTFRGSIYLIWFEIFQFWELFDLIWFARVLIFIFKYLIWRIICKSNIANIWNISNHFQITDADPPICGSLIGIW